LSRKSFIIGRSWFESEFTKAQHFAVHRAIASPVFASGILDHSDTRKILSGQITVLDELLASRKSLRNAARSRRPESMESQEFAIEHVPVDLLPGENKQPHNVHWGDALASRCST
jgi:hypothetical protein